MAPGALRRLLLEHRGREEALQSLRRFEALYPYLEFLASRWDRDPFDAEVVEAYWLGNSLLEPSWRSPFPALLERLQARGLPPSFASRLARNLPADPFPHHTFHVLFVGVGAVTGHVPTTLPNMERCRISWGEVRSVEATEAVVEGPTLAWDGVAFAIENDRRRSVAWDSDLVPGLARGEMVALHWETVVEPLHREGLTHLETSTERAIRAANEAARVSPPSRP